jgi:DNA invertase Pin-like site-specific DNA recombinase
MADGKFVAYYRVSSVKQGNSGLGLEAQRQSVSHYLNGGNWKLAAEFTEVESGKKNDRAALAKALAACRMHNATLIIAKLDRLARNAAFLLTVVEGTGRRGVVFCDLPHIPEGPTGKFIVGQMALVAELEGSMISQRTKDALAAAKARGTKLGGRRVSAGRFAEIASEGRKASIQTRAENASRRAADVLPAIEDIRQAGSVSLRATAASLNERGIPAPRGGQWTSVQVGRVLAR